MAKNKTTNRGNKPSPLTLHMLCSKAAGRCEFKGCNEYVFQDVITLTEFNKSNVAHIVASSPDGPRGDELRSHELSNKLENLMLMCPAHHKLIDDNEEEYPEAVLLAMKQEHEERIRELCSLIDLPKSERIHFTSPIKNLVFTQNYYQHTAKALLPLKRAASNTGIAMSIQSNHDYNSPEYWQDVDKQLVQTFERKIVNILDSEPNTHFSVFPLAPIPLIMKLGFLFMDKTGVDVYQKKRQPDTWEWEESSQTNIFTIEKSIISKGHKVAMVLSLTSEISMDRITNVFDADIIYVIKSANMGVDSIKSREDLSAFWHKYQSVCDEAKNTDKADEICVFPAIPVSAAFEVGHRYMPGVYPKLRIFDDNNGFFETLTIGGNIIDD